MVMIRAGKLRKVITSVSSTISMSKDTESRSPSLRLQGGGVETFVISKDPTLGAPTTCMSSEPFGQVSNRFKRGSGSSELKLWLQTDDAAGVVARWFSA